MLPDNIQLNLYKTDTLGAQKIGRLTEVAVLKGGRLERFYCISKNIGENIPNKG